MATTYTWGIHRLDFKTEEGSLSKVIKNATWYYTANNGVNITTHYGVETVSSPDANTFTQFDNLTENQVKSWIEPKLNHWVIKKGLDDELVRIANAPDARAMPGQLPWEVE